MTEILSNEEKNKRLRDAIQTITKITNALEAKMHKIINPIIPVTPDMYDDEKFPGFRGFGSKYGEWKQIVEELSEKTGIYGTVYTSPLGTKAASEIKLSKQEVSDRFKDARRILVEYDKEVRKLYSDLTTNGMSLELASEYKTNYTIFILKLIELRSKLHALGESFGLNHKPVKLTDITLNDKTPAMRRY